MLTAEEQTQIVSVHEQASTLQKMCCERVKNCNSDLIGSPENLANFLAWDYASDCLLEMLSGLTKQFSSLQS